MDAQKLAKLYQLIKYAIVMAIVALTMSSTFAYTVYVGDGPRYSRHSKVWVPGHWKYGRWVPGHYKRVYYGPRNRMYPGGRAWVPGHYNRYGRWVPGHWKY